MKRMFMSQQKKVQIVTVVLAPYPSISTYIHKEFYD